MSEEQKIPLTAFPYIANRYSKEVHKANCSWARMIGFGNRLPCISIEAAEMIRNLGYNGCYHCLRRYHTNEHPVSPSRMVELDANLLANCSEALPDGWLEITSPKGTDA